MLLKPYRKAYFKTVGYPQVLGMPEQIWKSRTWAERWKRQRLGKKQKLRYLFISFNFYSLQPKVQRKPIGLLALLPSSSFPSYYLLCCITVQLLEPSIGNGQLNGIFQKPAEVFQWNLPHKYHLLKTALKFLSLNRFPSSKLSVQFRLIGCSTNVP